MCLPVPNGPTSSSDIVLETMFIIRFPQSFGCDGISVTVLGMMASQQLLKLTVVIHWTPNNYRQWASDDSS